MKSRRYPLSKDWNRYVDFSTTVSQDNADRYFIAKNQTSFSTLESGVAVIDDRRIDYIWGDEDC
jgi:hypothetical protein